MKDNFDYIHTIPLYGKSINPFHYSFFLFESFHSFQVIGHTKKYTTLIVDSIWWKKQNYSWNNQYSWYNSTVVALDPKQRFLLDRTRKQNGIPWYGKTKYRIEPKKIMKVALRVGPEIQKENKGFPFSIDRGTLFSSHLRYYGQLTNPLLDWIEPNELKEV